MATSRSQLDRVLDPGNVSVRLITLIKAAIKGLQARLLQALVFLGSCRRTSWIYLVASEPTRRGSSAESRYSRPSGPMAVTWVTYSPDFAQWKCQVSPGRIITLPGG